MPIRHQKLIDNEVYHIVDRGVADSLIFKDVSDYYRGIFSIYEFNNNDSVEIRKKRKARLQLKKEQIKKFIKSSGGPSSAIDTRDLLVEILAFCFMPNHIHLLVRQIQKGGITKFMSKFGTGYAGYFNKKYSRKGYLFQGRFQSVHIKTDDQLKIVFVYIHTNPISLIESNWKEKGIESPEKVINFLENYKWSSYPDYIGKKNFPSITKKEFILETLDREEGCRKFLENWVKYKGEIKESAPLVLD